MSVRFATRYRSMRAVGRWLGAALGVLLMGGAPGEAREYVIGAGDVLAISVLENKDLDTVATVNPGGKITFPLVGEVQTAGLTAAELAARLTTELGKSIKNPVVTVSLREVNSYRIYFLGKVAKPGIHFNKSEVTLLQALSLAGGLTEGADLSLAFVARGTEKLPVDFHRLIREGDLSQNIVLDPEDIVVIPDNPRNMVYIMGEVKQPGSFPLSQDRGLSVLKAIAQAGGFTNFAAPSRTVILRESGERKGTIRVDVDDLIKRPDESQDTLLQAGDIVIVPQSLF